MKAIFVRRLGNASLYCVTVETGVLSGVTSILVGHNKNSSASLSTRGGKVAEKRMFWRLVWNHLLYLTDLRHESHVHHAVCFI